MSIHNSNGINSSDGINWSNGINISNGINWSGGINSSNGINMSNGINWSDGINSSYGIINSFGVDRAIFLADKKREWSIFGQEVSESRFKEVWVGLHHKLDCWLPKFNNAYTLYIANDNSWEGGFDANNIISTLTDYDEPYEAWKDMPQGAIDYIKSLPEFDADIFKRVTGLDVNKPEELIEIGGQKYSRSEIEAKLKDLKPIISNAI